MKAINVFELVVHDWIKRRPTGKPFFFVQIGAHDGLHLDPIHHFVMDHGWTGLLIEPQPDIFERLQANYKAAANRYSIAPDPIWFLQAAVAWEDGQARLHRFKPGQGLPDHASMLASFNQRAVQTNGHGYRGEMEEITVPAISVKTLCAKYPLQKLDLLQLDTEGQDPWIIRAMLELGIRPQIIHFESFWKSQEYYKLLPELEVLGYGRCEVGVNMVCYRQPEDARFEEEQLNRGYAMGGVNG